MIAPDRGRSSLTLLAALTLSLSCAACVGDQELANEESVSVGEPGAPRAQMTGDVVIADEPTCATCVVMLQDLVRLEDSPTAPIPAVFRRVTEDGLGRFWITFLNDLPLIYQPDGTLLRELGPRGQGPEEYQHPSIAEPLPGDSVLVFDRRRGAWFVLGPDLRRIRGIRVPRFGVGGQVVIHRWPSLVTMSSNIPAVEDTFHPYANLDFGGDEIRVLGGFGGTGGSPPPRGTLSRQLSAAPDGALWAYQSLFYAVERWTADGDRTLRIERHPAWFPIRDLESPRSIAEPNIQDVRQDAEGRLWVFTSVPREDWEDVLPNLSGSIDPSRVITDEVFRTTVEVLDLASGRVVARAELNDWIVSALSGGRAALYETSPLGEPSIRIVRLSLVD